MYSLGRDNLDGYDFKSEENLKKWHGFFIPTLQQVCSPYCVPIN